MKYFFAILVLSFFNLNAYSTQRDTSYLPFWESLKNIQARVWRVQRSSNPDLKITNGELDVKDKLTFFVDTANVLNLYNGDNRFQKLYFNPDSSNQSTLFYTGDFQVDTMGVQTNYTIDFEIKTKNSVFYRAYISLRIPTMGMDLNYKAEVECKDVSCCTNKDHDPRHCCETIDEMAEKRKKNNCVF